MTIYPPYHYRYDPFLWEKGGSWTPGYYMPAETTDDTVRRLAQIEKPQAWECPRCKTFNAPTTAKCDCKP